MNDYSIKYPSFSVKFSIETLMEEARPVIIEKFDFVDRHKSLLITHFEIVDYREFNDRFKTNNFFN